MNRYTCFPSEGGHAECAPALLRLLPPRRARINASLHSFLRYAPIDDLTHDLRDWMMNKFLFTGDNKGRHKEAERRLGQSCPSPPPDPAAGYYKKGKRVSVERVVSGPGLANIYAFLRDHWAMD